MERIRHQAGDGPAAIPVDALPALDGELVVDTASRAALADDFGHTAHRLPLAVLRPASVADVAAMLRFAAAHGLRATPRGQGHATGGQAQVSDGVVIDMRTLDTVHKVLPDRVVVDAGARWSDVLVATVPSGLTPPVLTDCVELTVGGTLAVGGVGGTSHLHGLQTDNVLELEVVTGDGRVRTCSPNYDRPLFEAALAGLGQCVVIVRATLRLVSAQSSVRRHRLHYGDPRRLLAAQRRLVTHHRFDHVTGHARPDEHGGWAYVLEVGRFHTPPATAEDETALADIAPWDGEVETKDLPYLDFVSGTGRDGDEPPAAGEWTRAHPWLGAFLPDLSAGEAVADVMATLTGEEVGEGGRVVVHPTTTDRFNTPLFRVPGGPVVVHVALLRAAPPDDPAAMARITSASRAFSERVRAAGGAVHPTGTPPLTRDDWQAHFGPVWPRFAAAKGRYDPHHVLTPGQRIFLS
ncbi:FAD-binding protein [Streptoalloteichus hindustanus]|uniref:FAD/FMN-containing dehydrogenase n=1 Tax=Streptoalloteichus hindustanus TaxID=2017 RepID=A0A1M5L1G8_STRHI|nr:FAD-binding protein [Streptoalloteichus hindustanus]SHG58770.1 FAD/FMN-containing dehydrogenase [Streptoalloteichus hindustanus]